MTSPRLALYCVECKWEPGNEITLELVKTHYQDKHPSIYAEDPDNLNMHLAVRCLRCNEDMGDPSRSEATAAGMIRYTYDCFNCARTYTLLQPPMND